MATIHTNSIREELDRIKQEFTAQTNAGEVSSSSSMLIKSLIMLLELMFSIFLEKSTKKNNNNSSKPSSQTGTDKTSRGSKGKGKAQILTCADNSRTVVTDIDLPVDSCQCCGESLEQIPCDGIENRKKIDIVFEKTVENYKAEIKTCPSCNNINKGQFPKGIYGKLQYGSGLKSFVIHLIVSQMVTLNRVQKMLASMIGSVLSEATLLSYILKLHISLEGWEQNAKLKLLSAPSLYVDETSMKVERKNHWIHVHAAGDITLKLLHEKRGKEAIIDNDIIPRYGGTLIHDCWCAYLAYTNCKHGLCGSHLLRELTFIIDSNNYKWAIRMRELLQCTCKTVSKSNRKVLFKHQYKLLQKKYRTIITQGEKEMPAIMKKSSSSKKSIAKSDAHNLWERLKKHEESVLRFAKESYVSFTNNRSERDLRMAKVKQKVSGCFRSKIYAQAYCRISSYLQTMSNKGINPLVAIQMALNGKISELKGE